MCLSNALDDGVAHLMLVSEHIASRPRSRGRSKGSRSEPWYGHIPAGAWYRPSRFTKTRAKKFRRRLGLLHTRPASLCREHHTPSTIHPHLKGPRPHQSVLCDSLVPSCFLSGSTPLLSTSRRAIRNPGPTTPARPAVVLYFIAVRADILHHSRPARSRKRSESDLIPSLSPYSQNRSFESGFDIRGLLSLAIPPHPSRSSLPEHTPPPDS